MTSIVEHCNDEGRLDFRLELGETAWWNTNSHLAKVIVAFLVQFRQAPRHGAPSAGGIGHSQALFPSLDEEARWNAQLDKMILAFQLTAEGNWPSCENSRWMKYGTGGPISSKIRSSMPSSS